MTESRAGSRACDRDDRLCRGESGGAVGGVRGGESVKARMERCVRAYAREEKAFCFENDGGADPSR